MDEDENFVADPSAYMPNELSQWASSLVELAVSVDGTKDKDAKRYLLKAMDGLSFLLDPPRGQLEEIKNDKAR